MLAVRMGHGRQEDFHLLRYAALSAAPETDHPTLRDTGLCRVQHLCFHITGFQPLCDQPPGREVANGLF